jgi:general secretion pathway protein F
MIRFQYRAIDLQGKQQSGVANANDRAEVLRQLRLQRLTVLDLRELKSNRLSSLLSPRGRQPRLPAKEIAFFARQLSGLLRAGMPLDRGLSIISQIVTRKSFAKAIVEANRQVRAGKSLAEALTGQGAAFPAYFVSMVRAGEMSGTLDSVLVYIAGLTERRVEMRSRMVSALIYPALLICATIGSVILIMTTVIPKFEPIFQQAGRELPMLTKVMVAISNLLTAGLPYIGAVAVATILAAAMVLKQPDSRLALDRFILSIPLVGPLIAKMQVARLSHVLGSLLIGGVPLVQALTITAGGVGNLAIRQRINAAKELVKNGITLSKALKRQGGFPSLFVQLLEVGEESAKLGDTLFDIARIYEDETDTAMQRVATLITPIATIGLGGVVALVLASVLLAVLQVNDLAF